jgi:hypothetical protein
MLTRSNSIKLFDVACKTLALAGKDDDSALATGP